MGRGRGRGRARARLLLESGTKPQQISQELGMGGIHGTQTQLERPVTDVY